MRGKLVHPTAKQLRAIQLKQVDALARFDEVCRKHGLRYYLVYGTLLGAVRHKGFIPWDDDSDIAMPRKDYEEFLRHGQEWMGEDYFIQNQTTDPSAYTFVTKIRINHTVFRRKVDAHLNCHHGIFLDIIPLDYVSTNRQIRRLGSLFRQILFTLSLSKLECRMTKYRSVAFASKFLSRFFSTRFLRRLVHASMKRYQNKPTGLVACLMSPYPLEKGVFPEEAFGTPVDIEFEGHLFLAPKDPHKILKKTYGDYMTPPPKSEQKPGHDIIELEIGEASPTP